MKIPGMESLTSTVDKLDSEMLPLLKRIADSLDELIEIENNRNDWYERNDAVSYTSNDY